MYEISGQSKCFGKRKVNLILYQIAIILAYLAMGIHKQIV